MPTVSAPPRASRLHRLERSQLVPRAADEVFAFFADAHNLEAITPPFLRFRIETPEPITMRPGARIDYRLQLFGLPFRWRTRIEAWEPGTRFVDVQERGPYRLWRHTHRFVPVPGGTVVLDTVEYALPLGPLGALAHLAFVRRSVERIFDHRRRVIAARFGAAPEPAGGASPLPSPQELA